MRKINILVLIGSAVSGLIAWIVGIIIYKNLNADIPMSILIGLCFLILTLLVTAVVFVLSNITDQCREGILLGGGSTGSALLSSLIVAVVTAAVAVPFQFLYGLNSTVLTTDATSYIFLIDDSGSMSVNDSYELRYKAISQVLEDQDQDFPFIVYTFADDTAVIRDMAPISDGIPELHGNANGGTAMWEGLDTILNDFNNKVWNGGSAPKIILLTDGIAGDHLANISVDDYLQEFVTRGITISTVGLGQVDEAVLKKIALSTGGVFVNISEADELGDALTSAAVRFGTRDLVSTRYTGRPGVLYAIIRIVFLTVLGIGVGLTAAVAYGRAEASGTILGTSVVKAVIGALIMEILTTLRLNDRFCWLLMWILFAVTVAPLFESNGSIEDESIRINKIKSDDDKDVNGTYSFL